MELASILQRVFHNLSLNYMKGRMVTALLVKYWNVDEREADVG